MWSQPPIPVAGNQPSVTEKINISRRPIQKSGIETPKRAVPMLRLSSQLFWRRAARIPIVVPKTIATAIAAKARRRVEGKTLKISLMTGRRVWIDLPKSPCSTRSM